MAQGQHQAAVSFIKYLQELRLVTGTVHGVGFTGTLLQSLEDTVSGTGPAVLKLQRFFTSGRYIYNFLARFLAFRLPAVPSSQSCLQESLSP